jgi:glycosyltransferase involved in cell wall biosynthesis
MSIVVSIDCITYNQENYIGKALESFLMQKTKFDFEILVHDDASTDRTGDIIREYQDKYPNIIKPLFESENQYSKGGSKRISYTYNHSRANGKYVALCEGDDYWIDPYKLQKQVDFMESHPECSMCFHSAEVVDVTTQTKVGLIKPFNKTCILPKEILFLGGGHICPTSSLLYLKKMVDNPPEFFMKSPVGDHAYALLLSELGRIGYINEPMSVRNLWVPGSWNTIHHLDATAESEQTIKHLEGMIELLIAFNEFSKGKWEYKINKTIIVWKIIIVKLDGKEKLLENEQIKMRIKNLHSVDKLQFYIRCKFPKLFTVLVYAFRKFKKCFIHVETIN